MNININKNEKGAASNTKHFLTIIKYKFKKCFIFNNLYKRTITTNLTLFTHILNVILVL